MAVNPYFNHLTSIIEQKLYEDLVIENIKNTGVDIYYLPREYLEIDPILREPKKSSFNSAYKIEIYFKDVLGYQGAGDLMTKFGLLIQNDTSFIMSRKRFDELEIPDRIRPIEGDLIYIGEGYNTFTNTLFEILRISQSPTFQLGKYFAYEIFCQTFTYNYEKFETNNPSIDTIVTENTNEFEIDIAINTAIVDKKQSLIDFSEKNPLGDL